jgi:predicted TIM-barrel fold metal-dependent hydrolase
MRQAGVERAIASSAEAIIYDLAAGNRWLADEIAGHPELLGYVTVNPTYLELSCQEMDRYYQQPNFVGAKLHCDYSSSPTNSEKTQRLLREVARRGKPLKIHVAGGGALQALREVALAFPEWAIVKAHGGGREAAEEVAEAPNIYFEFASSRCSSSACAACWVPTTTRA